MGIYFLLVGVFLLGVPEANSSLLPININYSCLMFTASGNSAKTRLFNIMGTYFNILYGFVSLFLLNTHIDIHLTSKLF